MEHPQQYEGTEFEIQKGLEPYGSDPDVSEDMGSEPQARMIFEQYLPPRMVEEAIKAMRDANMFEADLPTGQFSPH